jgi:hypothetical protein
MLNRVGGEIHGADIITIHHYSTTKRTTKLCEKLAQLTFFGTPFATALYSASALDRDTVG